MPSKTFLDCLIALFAFFWIIILSTAFPPIANLLFLSNVTLAVVIWRIILE